MVQEYHMTVLPANHVSIFYMGPTTNTQSHTKCTYMISREYNHVVLPNHTSISRRVSGESMHPQKTTIFLKSEKCPQCKGRPASVINSSKLFKCRPVIFKDPNY